MWYTPLFAITVHYVLLILFTCHKISLPRCRKAYHYIQSINVNLHYLALIFCIVSKQKVWIWISISFQYKQLSIQFGLHFQGLFDTKRTPTTNLPLSDHFGVRAELFVTFRCRFLHRICITSTTLGRIRPFLDLEDIDQRLQEFCPAPWYNTYQPGIVIP